MWRSAGVKIETEIIASIKASPIWQAVILMLMCIETFKSDVIIFIGNIIMYLMPHWPIISNNRITKLILTISLCKINGQMSKLLKRWNTTYLTIITKNIKQPIQLYTTCIYNFKQIHVEQNNFLIMTKQNLPVLLWIHFNLSISIFVDTKIRESHAIYSQ